MMIQGSLYLLFVPKQAVGANLVYFDFFNATGSGQEIELLSVAPVVSGAVAVTGVVAVDLHLTRTTAVGTGGTAATRQGTAIDAATFVHLGGSEPLIPTITARLTPTGGATAGALLGYTSIYSEETNAGTYTPSRDLARPDPMLPAILIPGNSGFRVVQGAVASVGNIGFNIVFKLRQK